MWYRTAQWAKQVGEVRRALPPQNSPLSGLNLPFLGLLCEDLGRDLAGRRLKKGFFPEGLRPSGLPGVPHIRISLTEY